MIKRVVLSMCGQLTLALIIAGIFVLYHQLRVVQPAAEYQAIKNKNFSIIACKSSRLDHCVANQYDIEGRLVNVRAMVAYEARLQNVPLNFALSVAQQESNFTCNVISAADAYGVMQVLYPTAKQMGYNGSAEELLRCHNSIKYGIKYLKTILVQTNYDYCLTANKYFNGARSDYTEKGRRYCREVLDKMQKNQNLKFAGLTN